MKVISLSGGEISPLLLQIICVLRLLCSKHPSKQASYFLSKKMIFIESEYYFLSLTVTSRGRQYVSNHRKLRNLVTSMSVVRKISMLYIILHLCGYMAHGRLIPTPITHPTPHPPPTTHHPHPPPPPAQTHTHTQRDSNAMTSSWIQWLPNIVQQENPTQTFPPKT